MYFMLITFLRCLTSCFFGLLRFTHTWLARFCRGISSSLRSTKQISMESDDDCEFDSTWEDEDENNTHRNKTKRSRRSWYAAKDMQKFRHSCQDLDDDGKDYSMDKADEGFHNLKFYRGQIRSSPDKIHIDDFHNNWQGQYEKLEDVHSYIQWLFPIQEQGVNWRAHVLTKKEIMLFRRDKEVQRKLIKSYEVMLDFYGMRLDHKDTIKVERAKNWKQRSINLNRHTHNNLRITRILKCLGTLGLEHYQAPLVKFFLDETLVNGELGRVKQSVLDYFIFAVLDKSKRKELIRYAYEHFRPREDFVWGPKKILQKETSEKGEQQRVLIRDCTHELEEIGIDKPCNNDDQKDDAVSQNKLKGENVQSHQGANNENSQGSSNDEMAENHYQGPSVDHDKDVDMIPDNTPHGDYSGCDESYHIESEETNEKDRPDSPEKMNEESGPNDKNSLYSLDNEFVKEQDQKSSGDGNNEIHMTPQNKPNGNSDESNPAEIGKTNENDMLDNAEVEMKDDDMSHGENDNNAENYRPGSPYKLTEQTNNEDKRSNVETNDEDESNLNNTAYTKETLSAEHEQGSNDENSQCNSEIEIVQDQNQKMSVDGDGDD
ncbi:opioid growth factor receptor-like protein 1 [Danio aesculapii]|uniref:opioid growth factor receptor-like protein 1 n=1 Tax=Danio aesculapii TaxID=1142201 RepID=UPI0024BF7746|nr:opioid growth factor receptor-like protein 1 [Danio aesculapii]